jgi:hypothetical protein
MPGDMKIIEIDVRRLQPLPMADILASNFFLTEYYGCFSCRLNFFIFIP